MHARQWYGLSQTRQWYVISGNDLGQIRRLPETNWAMVSQCLAIVYVIRAITVNQHTNLLISNKYWFSDSYPLRRRSNQAISTY